MKKLGFLLALALAVPVVTTSCQTAPTERRVEYQTLLAVGQAADAAVATSAKLYRDGAITAAQARKVLDFYNDKFQVAFRFAIAAARSDLSSVASPDVMTLAAQLADLVSALQPNR